MKVGDVTVVDINGKVFVVDITDDIGGGQFNARVIGTNSPQNYVVTSSNEVATKEHKEVIDDFKKWIEATSKL